jgi:biotin-dependent carboxylase-like uncharacterized protein
MRALEVVSPGPRTTVEDLGRRMVARFGIPPGGAFDPLSLVAANRLVGNDDGAAGLEATLAGPTLRNAGDEPLALAVVGADCDAHVERGGGRPDADGEPVSPGRVVTLAPGDRLRLGFARDAARAWIAVAGGVEVPAVLGSRATCVSAGFGGFRGRPLARDDRLQLGVPRTAASDLGWREPLVEHEPAPFALRFVRGPQWELFGEAGIAALRASAWRVQRDSDRTGIRLAAAEAGDAGASALAGVPGIAPEGTTLGAVQVPADGCPIVLGPDRPVTGGYAKPAVVVAADVGRLARLRPGDLVSFSEVTMEAACGLAAARRERLARLLA